MHNPVVISLAIVACFDTASFNSVCKAAFTELRKLDPRNLVNGQIGQVNVEQQPLGQVAISNLLGQEGGNSDSGFKVLSVEGGYRDGHCWQAVEVGLEGSAHCPRDKHIVAQV